MYTVHILLALLTVLAPSRGQESTCPITVQYDVNLGQGQTSQEVPIFLVSMSIRNNDSDNITVEEWRLGWQFPYGSYVSTQEDIFDSSLQLLNPGSTTPILETNKRALGVNDEFSFGLLGTKAATNNTTNPFNVGAPTGMAFNNMLCSMVTTNTTTSAEMEREPDIRATFVSPNASVVSLEYTPIAYVGQPLVNTFTQFLVRLRNVQNGTDPLELSSINIEYWFQGPADVPFSADSDPQSYFEATCEWATTGCDTVKLALKPGLRNEFGARFYVDGTFKDDAGLLLPSGDDAVAPIFIGQGESVVDILITLSARDQSSLFNSTQDYSYIETPSLPVQGNATIVPRRALPNPFLPAFVDENLVWGVPPQLAFPEATNETSSAESSILPPGVSCVATGEGVQTCGIAAVYCCTSPTGESLSAVVPEVWPPQLPRLPGTNSTNGTADPVLVPSNEPEFVFNTTAPPLNAGDTSPSNESTATSSSSSDSGMIIGIAVGVSLAVVGLLAALLLVHRRRRRHRRLLSESLIKPNGDVEEGKPHLANDSNTSPKNPLLPSFVASGGSARSTPTTLASQQLSSPFTNFGQSPRSVNLMKFPSGISTMNDTAAYTPTDPENSTGDDDGGLSPEAILFLMNKSCTAPALCSFSTVTRTVSGSMPSSNHGPRLPIGDNDPALDGQSSGDTAFFPRRTHSWDGVLKDSGSLDGLDGILHVLGRRKTAPPYKYLPPLDQMSPPVQFDGPDVPNGIDLQVDWDEIKDSLGHCLGTGGFGAVYEAEFRGQKVAVKKLPPFSVEQPGSQAMYQALLREIALASKFDCERLVRVYGACTGDRDHVCLIMELCENGNLFQRIYDRRRRRMSYLEILQVAHDVAAGLAYLHPAVLHLDLKPQNVLIDSTGRAKLADFGISKVKDPTKSYLSQVTADNGTPQYMSPEQFNGSRIDEKADVYALGCILNECWTRRQPWKDSNHFFQIILKVAINGERPWIDPDCPEPLKRLITKCWHQDRHMRPSCGEIARLTEIYMQEELRRWEENSKK